MSDAPHPPAAGELPEMVITMNQVVAYNIAYFRKIRGLTQEELGRRLEAITGKAWSKATMSAVERSWSGPRIRTFDADELIAFSQALGYPVSALLLPPEDDGGTVEYRFNNVGEGGYVRHPQPSGAGEGLMSQLFISEYGEFADEAYVERLQTAFNFYFGGVPEEAFFHNSRPEFVDEGVLQDAQAERLKHQVATLRDVIGMLDRAAKKIESGELAVKLPRESELQDAVRVVDAADPMSVRGARQREANSDFTAAPGITYGFFDFDPKSVKPKRRREQIQNALHVTRLFLLALRVWPHVGRAGVVEILRSQVPDIEYRMAKTLHVDGRLIQLISRAIWGTRAEDAQHAQALRLAHEGYPPEAALEKAQASVREKISAEWAKKAGAVRDVDAEMDALPKDPDAIERWVRDVWRQEISQ